jgi:SAM-dependent methyltransferase
MSSRQTISWLSYWDAPNASYVSERHKRAHYDVVFTGVRPHLRPGGVVLDWGCGDALAAQRMADIAGTVLLYDGAPSTRERLRPLHATRPGIHILDDAGLGQLPSGSVDLVIVNSVIQYLGEQELAQALTRFAQLLKTDGALLIGDVITPGTPMLHHVATFLGFALRSGFLPAAVVGLVRTSASPYRRLQREVGLKSYAPTEMITLLSQHGFTARRLAANIAVSRHRAAYLARKSGTGGATARDTLAGGIAGAA